MSVVLDERCDNYVFDGHRLFSYPEQFPLPERGHQCGSDAQSASAGKKSEPQLALPWCSATQPECFRAESECLPADLVHLSKHNHVACSNREWSCL